MDQARKVLHWLREGTADHESITHELRVIAIDIDARSSLIFDNSPTTSVPALSPSPPVKRNSFIALSLSLFRDPSLRARLWRAFLLQFLAQMCGAAAMKYYLPSLLEALGLNTRLALMAGALEMTLKIGMAVVEMWVIDRFGRRLCLVGGSLIMAVAMLVRYSEIRVFERHALTSHNEQINGILPLVYPNNTSRPADVICIIFIFIYAMGYSLGLGPAAWIYSSEVNHLISLTVPGEPMLNLNIRSFPRPFALVASTLLHRVVLSAVFLPPISGLLASHAWDLVSTSYLCLSTLPVRLLSGFSTRRLREERWKTWMHCLAIPKRYLELTIPPWKRASVSG